MSQDLNAYSYSLNNPITYSDPSGLNPYTCPDGSCSQGGKATMHPTPPSDPLPCDETCEGLQALNGHRYGNDIDKSLAKELTNYVNVLHGGYNVCAGQQTTSSGLAAACYELAGMHNSMTWQEVLQMFFDGPGGTLAFNQGDLLTRQLMTNSENVALLKQLYKAELAGGFSLDPHAPGLGGMNDHRDPSTLAQFLKDNLGMVTDGGAGTSIPDAFFGSYNEVYQVIGQDPKTHSITVAFAVRNMTGIESLTHYFPDRNDGRSLSTVRQDYFWVVTIDGT